jgi:hypothetical protein
MFPIIVSGQSSTLDVICPQGYSLKCLCNMEQKQMQSTNIPKIDNMYSTSVDLHNTYRNLHQVGILVWNSNIALTMQQWIEQCMFGHDQNNKLYGENLYALYGQDTMSHDQHMINAVNAWYNEISMYNFANQGFTEQTGHLTALIWKSSVEIGCFVKSCQGFAYVGCRYYPAGNVIGQFEQNVFPKIKK